MLNQIRSANMEKLIDAMVELREDEVLKMVKERVEAGEDPLKIVNECREGIIEVGKRFEAKEYFVPDLIMSGEIFKEAMEILKPKMAGKSTKKLGNFVIGTVSGDIHDIGKDITATVLEANGFEVYNLGVDIPPEKFIEKIKETNAFAVGLCGLMTLSHDPMKETVELIKKEGLRDKVKIIIGGGTMDESVRESTGADAWTDNAAKGVDIIKGWVR